MVSLESNSVTPLAAKSALAFGGVAQNVLRRVGVAAGAEDVRTTRRQIFSGDSDAAEAGANVVEWTFEQHPPRSMMPMWSAICSISARLITRRRR